jgi:hypothetical protein
MASNDTVMNQDMPSSRIIAARERKAGLRILKSLLKQMLLEKKLDVTRVLAHDDNLLLIDCSYIAHDIMVVYSDTKVKDAKGIRNLRYDHRDIIIPEVNARKSDLKLADIDNLHSKMETFLSARTRSCRFNMYSFRARKKTFEEWKTEIRHHRASREDGKDTLFQPADQDDLSADEEAQFSAVDEEAQLSVVEEEAQLSVVEGTRRLSSAEVARRMAMIEAVMTDLILEMSDRGLGNSSKLGRRLLGDTRKWIQVFKSECDLHDQMMDAGMDIDG